MNMQDLKLFFREKRWRNLKRSDWVVLGLIGILLLVVATPLPGQKTESDVRTGSSSEEEERENDRENVEGERTEEAYVTNLEKKLETVLEAMDGVGDVEVMITISDMGEHVVEKDSNTAQTVTTETDSAGGSRTVSENTAEEKTIYVEAGEETYPYIQKEKLPTIEGVVVVAEGGASPVVVSNISEAVKALLPVEMHRIKVVKMCSKEE